MLEDGGVYVFHYKKNPMKVLDVYGKGTTNGTNIQICNYNYGNNQRFQALKTGNYYMFKDLNSGKVLDVEGGVAQNCTNIILCQQNNGDNQKWKVIDLGNGYCSFQSKINSKYYLDVKYGGSGNEDNVWLYEGNNTDAQKFKPILKILYKFRVGVKGLGIKNVVPEHVMRSLDITHAAFLIGSDLFEYGTDPLMPGYVALNNIGIKTYKQGYFRIKNYNRNKPNEPFDWERIGSKLNGTTWIQPDELDVILSTSGKWTNENYNVINHNCHDFVKECILICTSNQGMALKLLPVFRPH